MTGGSNRLDAHGNTEQDPHRPGDDGHHPKQAVIGDGLAEGPDHLMPGGKGGGRSSREQGDDDWDSDDAGEESRHRDQTPRSGSHGPAPAPPTSAMADAVPVTDLDRRPTIERICISVKLTVTVTWSPATVTWPSWP